MRRHELCGVGPEVPASDKGLLVTPVTHDVRIAVLEKCAMHFKDGASIDGLGQSQGRLLPDFGVTASKLTGGLFSACSSLLSGISRSAISAGTDAKFGPDARRFCVREP